MLFFQPVGCDFFVLMPLIDGKISKKS